ncbi:ribosomal protein S18-alanine N-acetyltransferase [Nocardioides sp. zg-536]|uniref:Ribosomal protein S18-alanine N-acetyltransferase n=1 Tax=Nocardioides faecalis TaxID=2803858 RepID=A0A938Y7R7_9ACTN|nr:ribosomal protein S18-alanine N-acetyltransferase [Nocardioides faecalis]MBM9459743.1 ribosomal protein S18-alanine N-acetyltransferase [Nocardioides faecalis]QVI58259.1 ribosomal protein S18-alanine N-acetyltransferase [Nocardioides faecalis]
MRPATPADVPAIVALEAEAFPLDPWSHNLVSEGVRDALPTVSYLVAEEPGSGEGLVGYAVLSLVVPDAELQRIAVVPHCRRSGTGAALLAAVREHAADAGATRLLLEVREDNAAAIALYAAHGFAELGRRPRYYRDGTDAIVLSLTLPEASSPDAPVTMEA